MSDENLDSQETPEVPSETPEQSSPAAQDPTIEAAQLIANNSDLVTQINAMMTQAPPAPQTQEQPPASNAPSPATDAEGFQFDDNIVDNVVTDPQAFANHIAQTIFDRMSQTAPTIVQQQLEQQMMQQQQMEQQAQQVREYFYGQHPDLVGKEQIVGAVAAQLEQQYPTLNMQQLMHLTAQTLKSTTNVTEQPLGNETVRPLTTQGLGGNVVQEQDVPEATQDMLEVLKDANAGNQFY